MSKRNTKQALYQPASPAKRRPTGVKSKGKQPVRGSGGKPRPASGAATAQAAPRIPARTSLLMVRIAAIVVAVTAVIGGSAWAMSIQNRQGGYGTAEVAGLIVLGFLAGLGIAVAIRTEEIAGRVSKLLRARR